MPSSVRKPVVAGVDIGSTNLKVVAVSGDGVVVARAVRPTPRDAATLLIDAASLLAAIEEMVIAVCGSSYRLEAISTAGIGEDGVLLRADLTPSTPALAWFAPIRQELFRAIVADIDDSATVDVRADPTRSLVGWAWARQHPDSSPDDTWVALTDIPGVLWSGRPFLSDTLASRTGAWCSSGHRWAAERVAATLGSVHMLPPIVRSGETVGPLNAPTLRSAGVLSTSAIVVAGGHDHPVGGWGVNRMVPGVVLDSMGTAEVVVSQSPKAAVSGSREFDCAPGIRSEGATILRVEELARNVEWASREPDVARHLRALLGGRERALPVLDSGYFHPGPRGGGSPSYRRDTPTDPRVRASAVLGALAIAGREAVDAVRAESGVTGEVRLAGGWLRSPGWVDIKAEADGYRAAPILEPEVTAVGAALLAADALGWTPDPSLALSGFTAPFH